MKKILKESGLRNIKALAERYPKAKIYFHQDLDGVTTALAMKNYLEDNGIKVVDSEIIQYGDKEFAVKKQDAEGDTMPVLVDFAHGKPMFVVHTDHHDSQTGVEGDTATSFRPSRSNVATLSQIMSPKEIFPSDDITLISTVDSADFARFGLTPDDIMNFVFKLQKDKSLQKNKMALGLATNKLMLAYKNKPGFMEELVMTSRPSLLNIFQNINRIAAKNGYALPEEMALNQKDYVAKQKESEKVRVEDGIIVQYGGGSMFKPGSYDRYTPFKNNPDADFLVIAWPMGLVQASCNPFNEERQLRGVNLGEIAQEVLGRWEDKLREKIIPLSTIKWVSETSIKEGSVGFTNADLEAFYGDKIRSIEGGEQKMERLKEIMDTPSTELTDNEWAVLDRLGVPAWEMIQANSGGHKCITNISSLNYFGRSKRPPQGKYKYNKDSGDAPYVKFAKMIQAEFVNKLKEKIAESKGINEEVEKADLVDADSNELLDNIKNIQGDIERSDSKNMRFKQDVESFQIGLSLLGYELPKHGVDGLFGPETEGALNEFKKDNELEENGIFDTDTRDIMHDKLKSADIKDEDIEKYTYASKEFSSLDGKITHRYSGMAARGIQRLIDTMVENGVTDPVAQVGMLAVIGKETHFINKREKGYHNTSNERIRKIFSRTRSMSDSELNNLKKDYDKFFDFVYNGRIGNNNENDGSKYVGRGYNQLTGKANYEKYGNKVGIDIVNNPDKMLDDKIAAEVAVKFLTSKGVPEFRNPKEATLYFADVNSGSPKRRARENSIEELQKFDIVQNA
jgi:putative chitinase